MKREYESITIDAWHDGEGWYWNDIRRMDTHQIDDETISNSRKLLKFCRDEGMLTERSKGKCYVADDGFTVEIRTRDHCPQIAFQLVN